MKKITLYVICFFMFSLSSAMAGNIGLGVSVDSNDRAIYLPIRVEGSFRVEPFVSYSKYGYKNQAIEYGDSRENGGSTLNLGVGAFKQYLINEKVSAYYGLRTSYIKTKRNYDYGYGRSDEKMTGFTLSPTFGFEYLIAEDFLIGFEAEWSFYDFDGKEKRNTGEPEYYIKNSNIDDKGQGTNTRVIVRYFF